MHSFDLILINPPHPQLVNPCAQAPLGLLYLAAAAENAGLQVAIANLSGMGVEPERWPVAQANAYGITGTYLDVDAVNAVAEELKRRFPEARVFVGGPVVLSRDELTDAIDTVVFGEGESEIVGLASEPQPAFLCGTPLECDAVPFPARHLWSGPFGGDVFIGRKNYFGGGSATLLTTRGCPFQCAFCAGPALASRQVRFRNPAHVIAEMEELVQRYGVRQFRLSDEFFTCKRSHVKAVCGGIMESRVLGHGAGIAWRASIGVNPHDLELFTMMAAAGCKEVSFGVETLDGEVMALLTNKATPSDSIRALKNAGAAGIRTRALLMVGLPGETHATCRLNKAFLRTGIFDVAAITVFTPVPGCAVSANPSKFGCEIVESRAHRSLCVYGPDGKNEILPTIRTGRDEIEWARDMRETIELAEQLGKLGKG